MNAQRQRPPVIDLVRIEEIEPMLTTTELLLADLESRARDTRRTAVDLEAQLAQEGGHPETCAWMVIRLRQFVLQLWREAEEEALLTVMSAQRLARERLRPRALPLSFSGAFANREAETADEVLAIASMEFAPAVPVLTWEPIAEPVREPVLVAPAFEAPAFETSAFETPPLVVIDLVDHISPEALVDPVDPVGAAPDMGRDFWTDAETSPRWRRRRPRVTAAAALTVSAVIVTGIAVAIQVV